jgi:hypothetical protein
MTKILWIRNTLKLENRDPSDRSNTFAYSLYPADKDAFDQYPHPMPLRNREFDGEIRVEA